jgi:hypothetical protein
VKNSIIASHIEYEAKLCPIAIHEPFPLSLNAGSVEAVAMKKPVPVKDAGS